jgi:ribonucleoside-diphosphate reductase alpha chain
MKRQFCNLGSVNLTAHTTKNGINKSLLEKTIKTAIRMLDNVIDINYYPTTEARNSNLRHRPIGLGVMGFQDALYIQGISYASESAVVFADASMELIFIFMQYNHQASLQKKEEHIQATKVQSGVEAYYPLIQ